jgi:serine acetyltransferase
LIKKIVGAGSVVTKDVKPNTVVFGKGTNEQSEAKWLVEGKLSKLTS